MASIPTAGPTTRTTPRRSGRCVRRGQPVRPPAAPNCAASGALSGFAAKSIRSVEGAAFSSSRSKRSGQGTRPRAAGWLPCILRRLMAWFTAKVGDMSGIRSSLFNTRTCGWVARRRAGSHEGSIHSRIGITYWLVGHGRGLLILLLGSWVRAVTCSWSGSGPKIRLLTAGCG